jgi:hypothetical protein
LGSIEGGLVIKGGPVGAFGFDVFGAETGDIITFIASQGGGQQIDTMTFAFSGEPTFLGITTALPGFTSVQVFAFGNGEFTPLAIDNITVGARTPEASTLSLMAVPLVCLLLRAKRAKRLFDRA